ncbi:MAG: heme NO-binding domain-containing protein [Chloroflexota bacterium]
MKGIVFTEFLEMVEDQFGWELAEDIVDESDLPSGGAYTAVGTYHHQEIVSMVVTLSQKVNAPVPDLLKAFGTYLFGRFHVLYGSFFEGVESAFDFLASIDQYIHVEVRKLYPEAELPAFSYEYPDENTLVMNYSSSRPFADFAEGLLMGCIQHFDESITIERKDLNQSDGREAKFTLIRIPEPVAGD